MARNTGMPKMASPLNEMQCRKARAKDKPYKMFDGGGLYLLVTKVGTKLWHMRYRFNNRETTYSLGSYPVLTLSEARDERLRIKRLIKNGINPLDEKNKLKGERSFKKLAIKWHEAKSGSWRSKKHTWQVIDSLEKETFSAFGNQDAESIMPAQVLKCVQKIEARGAQEIARRTLQRISQVFLYGISIGWCDSNPANGLSNALRSRQKGEMGYLTFDELPSFIKALNDYNGNPTTIIGIHLLIHLFLRPGELRFGRWDEVDFDKKLWLIPAERMKMKRDHLIPLSRQALILLKKIYMYTGQYKLIFASTINPNEQPISENTLNNLIKRIGFNHATSHGFRKTASTYLNEKGWSPDAIERQLAHVSQNKVRSAYNKALYLDERIKMMQYWSDEIDNICN